MRRVVANNGQQGLPMAERMAQSRMAVDVLVDVIGRATIETVLHLSSEQVAGSLQQGRSRQGEIVLAWKGSKAAVVILNSGS